MSTLLFPRLAAIYMPNLQQSMSEDPSIIGNSEWYASLQIKSIKKLAKMQSCMKMLRILRLT
jgi:hypothetical protein